MKALENKQNISLQQPNSHSKQPGLDQQTMERIFNLEHRMTGTPVSHMHHQQQIQKQEKVNKSDEEEQGNIQPKQKLVQKIKNEESEEEEEEEQNDKFNVEQVINDEERSSENLIDYQFNGNRSINICNKENYGTTSNSAINNNNSNLQNNKQKSKRRTLNSNSIAEKKPTKNDYRKSSIDSNDSQNAYKCTEKLEDTKNNKKLTDYFSERNIKRSNSRPNSNLTSLKRKVANSPLGGKTTTANVYGSGGTNFIHLGNTSNSNNLFLNQDNSNNGIKKSNNYVFDCTVVNNPDMAIQIKDLKDQIAQKDKIIKNREEEIKQKMQELDNFKKEKQIKEESFGIYKQKVMQITAQNKLQIEKQIRQERKNFILAQKTRLGEIGQQREGTKLQDVWKEGIEFIKIKERIQEINQEKEELEKQKKQIKPEKEKKKNMNNLPFQTSIHSFIEQGDSNSQYDISNEEKKQIIDYQIMVLKREEQSLMDKQQELEHEKIMLIQKMKLDFEEANCRFGRNDLPLECQWPILEKRYQLLGLLGKGGFSEVYKAYDLDEMKIVACKIHQLNPNWSENSKISYIKHAIRETQIHRELIHPNIVRLYDSVEIDSDAFCTLLEYCEGPDLSYYMKQQKALCEKEAKSLIKQILNGLRYMHNNKNKVIHYDLKPQNIMFHKGQLKISDFGLCKIIEDEATRLELTSQGVGTYWYLPPETFQQGDVVEIATKVDVWSLGVIFYEMIYGQRPFGHGMSQDKILKEGIILKATSVNFPLKSPAQQQPVSKECQEFIRKCLTYRMEERWDINDAFNHPYMQKK